MSTAIEMSHGATQLESVTRDKVTQYLTAFGLSNNLTAQETDQFVEICQAFQLNPFKREAYCIPYGEGDRRKLSIITGFEVYLKRAERTNLLDGWKVWTEGKIQSRTVKKEMKKRDGGSWFKDVTVWEGDLKAVIEIYRKDRSRPFIHEVIFSEYAQDNDMWGGKPHTMIKKVAMAQGFRLCFPDEIGGMPYTADELPDEMTAPRNVTPQEQPAAPQASKPAPKQVPPTEGPALPDEGKQAPSEFRTQVIGVVAGYLKGKTDDQKKSWKDRLSAAGNDEPLLSQILDDVMNAQVQEKAASEASAPADFEDDIPELKKKAS